MLNVQFILIYELALNHILNLYIKFRFAIYLKEPALIPKTSGFLVSWDFCKTWHQELRTTGMRRKGFCIFCVCVLFQKNGFTHHPPVTTQTFKHYWVWFWSGKASLCLRFMAEVPSKDVVNGVHGRRVFKKRCMNAASPNNILLCNIHSSVHRNFGS